MPQDALFERLWAGSAQMEEWTAAVAQGVAAPRIIAHRDAKRRMDRYALTQGLNSIVQGQQFNDPAYVYPVGHRQPDEVYDDTLKLAIGGERIELFHGRGETDDATF